MTRVISKLTEHINLNSDVKEIQRYEFKLQNASYSYITAKLHEIVIDEKELENILNFCTEQEFRVIQMRKSIKNYTHQFTNANIQKSNSGNRSRRSHTDHSAHTPRYSKHHLLSNPNPSYIGNQNFGDNSSINVISAPKSLNSQGSSSSRSSYVSSNFSDSGSSKKGSSDSYVSNPSYLAVLERRRTAENAELLVKQAEERTQIKLKLLQKSFDYEKEAKSNRAIVNFETYGYKKPDFERKTYEHELPQKHSSFNIDNTYQNSAPSLNPSVKSNRSNAETVYDIAAFDTQNKIKDNPPFSVIHESPDEFIDHLVEGEETNLGIKTSSVNLHFAFKQDYEIRNLPPIELRRFSGNPCEWPEFIENFPTRVHLKSTFDDNLRMERLCSVLYGEAKRVIETIGNTRRFYATALKTLKRDFGNPLLISHAKLKLLFDQTQIKSADRISLRRFHQQLKINNACLLSMGYCTPVLSNDNLTKVIMWLPSFLRRDFFKATKNSNMLDGSVNLITLKNWLDKKLKSIFNPLADIISNEKDKQKEKIFT